MNLIEQTLIRNIEVGEGDVINYYINDKSHKARKQYTSIVQYKKEFGNFVVANNNIYKISELYNIVIIKFSNKINKEICNTVDIKILPKTWDDIENLEGYYVSDTSSVTNKLNYRNNTNKFHNKNLFSEEELAYASIALSKLSQLRTIYRQGWKPNWMDIDEPKYVIRVTMNEIETGVSFTANQFLAFQNYQIRDEFFTCFKKDIQQAIPLLFG